MKTTLKDFLGESLDFNGVKEIKSSLIAYAKDWPEETFSLGELNDESALEIVNTEEMIDVLDTGVDSVDISNKQIFDIFKALEGQAVKFKGKKVKLGKLSFDSKLGIARYGYEQ